jgi:hypothetical protein
MPSSITLNLLYLGCQWKELPIEKDATGRREIHHSRIWRTFRRWVADGCFNAIFEGTVLTLHQAELLDVSIIHGDGTTTAAKLLSAARQVTECPEDSHVVPGHPPL